jgi:hypothetical protein
VRAPIAPRPILVDDAEAFEPAQHDVEAAVGQRFDVRDDAAAADRIHRRRALVVAVPARPQQHHADHAVAGHRVRHHLAISRLEDVQREKDVGEEHNVRQRKSGAGQTYRCKSEVGSLKCDRF